MNTSRCNTRGCAGASLVEVLVALSLVAVSMLGVAAARLAALHEADTSTRRARASWLAASIAETMRLPEGHSVLLEYSRARAQAIAPGTKVEISDGRGDIASVVVHWPGGAEHGRPPDSGPCSAADGYAPAPCIALSFFAGGK
jgi:hypothetical protein